MIWVNDWGNDSSHSFQPSPLLGLLMKLENLVVEDANEFSGFNEFGYLRLKGKKKKKKK